MSSHEQDSSNAANSNWTLGKLLTWTTQYLKQHGSESPQLDAQLLLAHARGCQRIDLYTAYEEEASADLRQAFRELVKQRAAGAPVAHLVGHREFYSLDFRVTPDVLIPRPETEFLVIGVTDLVKETEGVNEPLQIADVGTGSGILACTLAKHLPAARIWATDVSEPALKVAAENCAAHGVSERVELLRGNLLEPIASEIWFDFIVSNPPYVTASEYQELLPEVRDYEPREALLAGESGLEVIEPLLEQAANRLKPGGWLLVEISPMLEAAVHELVSRDIRFGTPHTIRDLAGHARIVKATIPP